MSALTRQEKTRKSKYPNNRSFKWHNANPHHRITGDCLIRALSTAIEIPYEQALKDVYEMSLKTGWNGTDHYPLILEKYGFKKQAQPKRADGTKYRFHQIHAKLKRHGRVFAKAGAHHVVAVVDGVVHDIWDSSREVVGNYWIKED